MRGVEVVCEVVNGGVLREQVGINLPGVDLSVSPMTAKDYVDLAFGIAQEVDYVALSFVRRAEDMPALQSILKQASVPIAAVAKLEKPQAIEVLDDIIALSDAVMVARGDLGVELSPERVPSVQKSIIRAAVRAGKPVITATQMLESMIENPRPTRAEASDVANAVLDGTDAVMLSGETAVGQYPVDAIQIMDRIMRKAERGLQLSPERRRRGDELPLSFPTLLPKPPAESLPTRKPRPSSPSPSRASRLGRSPSIAPPIRSLPLLHAPTCSVGSASTGVFTLATPNLSPILTRWSLE